MGCGGAFKGFNFSQSRVSGSSQSLSTILLLCILSLVIAAASGMTLDVKTTNEKKAKPIYYLSGLTCTDENVCQKGGAFEVCAARGVAFVAPDTSPRGAGIDGEDDGWDFGTGAGFYVNAVAEPWSKHYNMYDYITKELPGLITSNFPIARGKSAIMGHSMGGHGALTLAFKNLDAYCSVSAFAPICNPVNCPWGEKAFTGYLGSNKESWKEYDATCLMRAKGPFPSLGEILIDQGTSDNFLAEQLKPEAMQEACKEKVMLASLKAFALNSRGAELPVALTHPLPAFLGASIVLPDARRL